MGTNITLKASDGHSFGAYEVTPKDKVRGGLVVIQEIFGVNAHIRKVAEEYADDGYQVIAPALFDRAERNVDLGYEAPDRDRGIALRQKIDLAAMMRDVGASVDALKGVGRVGIVGYCLGGSLAWLAAAQVPGLAAAVGYYGGMIAKQLGEKPRCPVMLHFGENDTGIPLSDVEAIRKGTDPKLVEVFSYAGAGHAFNRAGNAAHHAASARLARDRTVAFLRQYVG